MSPFWLKTKNQVLGKKYDLSVFFLPDKEMKRLNKTYRKKDYPANVLSFPLSENNGEILINEKYGESNLGTYLFVHSLFHLKGMAHGKEMNEAEESLMKIIFPKDWKKIIHSF